MAIIFDWLQFTVDVLLPSYILRPNYNSQHLY